MAGGAQRLRRKKEEEEEEGRVFEEGEEVAGEELLLSPLVSFTPPAAIFCEPTKLLVCCLRRERWERWW